MKDDDDNKIYGISQNPNTKDYIMVIQDRYCETCGEKYTDIEDKWCKPCQISYLKRNFTYWASRNEKIDNFIKEKQLEINYCNDEIFEWIPYNQFDNIKEISKDGFSTLFSAIWKNGQLNYDKSKKIYKRILRNQNQKVSLKCYNSQNITDEFFNEVQIFFIN